MMWILMKPVSYTHIDVYKRQVLDHHWLVVLVQNGLEFRAVLVGLDHLGDTPGLHHQILCPFFFHPANLQAADLLVLKASSALVTVTLLVGDRPIQSLLFGADLAGVTGHYAQRHNCLLYTSRCV